MKESKITIYLVITHKLKVPELFAAGKNMRQPAPVTSGCRAESKHISTTLQGQLRREEPDQRSPCWRALT